MPDIDSGAFFKPGGTLDPSAPSYIARAADERLLKALLAHEYVFLLDSRQKGKSSLVARTIVQLREAGMTTVKLDLQRIGANVTPEQWYAGLLAGIGQELDLTAEIFAYWGANQAVGPLARWVGAIVEVVLPSLEAPIIVFVDEVDFVRALAFSTDEFFAAVRDCYNRRSEIPDLAKLTFCLVGVATPAQLIRNPEITPFNIGTRIDLSDFTLEELEGYAVVLDTATRDGPSILRRVHHWLNGHPYLTQLLCSRVAGSRDVVDAAGVDRLVHELFLSPEARQREPNFADVERRLLEPDIPGMSADERRTQVLELYGRMLKGQKVEVSEENPVVGTVRLSGVGGELGGELRVRNRVYEAVFNEAWRYKNLPDAELRRQRAAAHKAVLKTLVVAGVVLAIVTAFAVANTRLAAIARRDRDRALYESYASSMVTATQFWEDNYLTGVADVVRDQANYAGKGWEWAYWKHLVGRGQLQDDDGTSIDFRWSRDGKAIVCRGRNGIRWLDATTGKLIREIRSPAAQLAATFEIPGGRLAEISWGGRLNVWDIEARAILKSYPIPPLYWRPDAMIDPTGRFVVGSRSKGIWRCDIETGAVLWNRTPNLDRATFSPDGKELAVSAHDYPSHNVSAVVRLDAGTLKEMRRYPVDGSPSSVQLSKDRRMMFVGFFGGALEILDMETGKALARAKTGEADVWRMQLSPDGKFLSVGTLGGVAAIYEVEGARLRLVARLRGALDAHWSPDGKRVLASSLTANIYEFNEIEPAPLQIVSGGEDSWIDSDASSIVVRNGNALETYDLTVRAPKPRRQVFDGQFVRAATGIASRFFKLSKADGSHWIDPTTMKEVCHAPAELSESMGYIPLADSQRAIFLAINNEASLYDFGSRQLAKLNVDLASSVVRSPSGRWVIIAGLTGVVTIWDVESDKFVRTENFAPYTLHSSAFLPDESCFVGAFDNGKLHLIETRTGKRLRTYAQHAGNARAVAISPDGKRVASGGDDRSIRIWDFETGRLLSVLKGHTKDVDVIAFIEGGDSIASKDLDGKVLVWRTKPYGSK